jgi:parallel beta-helix repeat protein
MPDVIASGSATPGVEWKASPELVYYEDRVIFESMYRTQNAKYSGGTWTQQDVTLPSFAIVENPDGSIRHFSAPLGSAPWTSWPNDIGAYGVFNVLAYGAVPDGVTPCDAAINAAVQAASQYSTPDGAPITPATAGGVVYLPPGYYLITRTIILEDNVELVGAFAGNTTIAASSGLLSPDGLTATACMVSNSGRFQAQDTQYNMAVRNLTLFGNASENGGTFDPDDTKGTGATIAFLKVTDVTIEGCRVYSCPNSAITVDQHDDPNNAARGNIRILNNTIDILPTRSGGGTPTSGNLNIRMYALNVVLIQGNVIGFNIPASELTYMQTWSNDGIDVPGCSEVTITGNMMTFVADGIGLAGASNCLVSNNFVNNFIGVGVATFADTDTGFAVDQLIIANNVIIGSQYLPAFGSITPGAQGIWVNSGSSVATGDKQFTVTGNVVVGPFQESAIRLAASYGSCTGNFIDLNHYQGLTTIQPQIGIHAGGDHLSIAGNQIDDTSGSAAPVAGTIGIRVPQDGVISIQNRLLIDGNSMGSLTVGLDIENSITGAVISGNDMIAATTAIGVGVYVSGGTLPTLDGCLICDNNAFSSGGLTIAAGVIIVNSRIAGNLGINPPSPSAISQPPYSTGTVTNNTPFDCMVYVVGLSLTGIKVNSHSIGWPVATASIVGPIGVHLSVNATISATGSGASWVWIPE